MTVCKRCVMDSSDPNITFNDQGFCNHCQQATPLERLFNQVKHAGAGKRYDSLVGLSGGTDSSFLSLQMWKHHLRPLATQLDNGYGTEEANHNVKAILDKTGWDFKKLAVNPKEFDDLHLAYLKASVIDIEVPSDHAIAAWNYHLAAKHHIRFVLSGSNMATESIMPLAWGWNKGDLANLRGIHKRYGTRRLHSFPMMGPVKKAWLELRFGIRQVFPLNMVDYNRFQAKQQLREWCGWQDYGMKHFESVITRFYQGYILPRKFGVDKRKAHYSALICSGQMTRREALAKLLYPLEYPELEADKKQVLERLNVNESEFERLMQQPPRSHREFASDEWLFGLLRKFRFMRKLL